MSKMQKGFLFTIALAFLLSSQVNPTAAIFSKKTGDDGQDRVIVHDEAIIPTHTVTQTATETATETHTVEKHTIATPMPEVRTYHLRAGEPVPTSDTDKVLLRREVIDVFLRNGSYVTGMVQSGAETLMLHPFTIVLSSLVVFCFMLS